MTEKKIVHNPFKIVEMFEEEVAAYTGAPYAVAVDSCTNAIFLCCEYHARHIGNFYDIQIPLRTYLSVPIAVEEAGLKYHFCDKEWSGSYRLAPTNIYDSAKRFTSGMYVERSYMCLSFHIKKHLPIGKGGMILTDNLKFVKWAKRARYEGRGACNYDEDDITHEGWNMYMTPEEAARGLTLMMNYPEHMPDLPEKGGYRPLNEFTRFKDIKVVI